MARDGPNWTGCGLFADWLRTHGLSATEAMALYRYVPSRECLLDGVVERVVDELYADPEVHLLPNGSRQEYLFG